MKLKPSIFDEISSSYFGAPPPPPPKYTDTANDETYLEDESGRVRIVGPLVENSILVTGCVTAILGRELPSGDFEVLDMRFTEYAPQHPIPEVSHEKAQYIAVISGLAIDSNTTNENYLQPLIEFFNGELGGDDDHEFSSKILHLIIAGNSLSSKSDVDPNNTDEFSTNEVSKIPLKRTKDFTKVASDPVTRLDQLIKDVALSIPITIMPGATDLSNLTLPQQPIHKALFHLSEELQTFDSFFSVSNPNYWSFNGVEILGDSGQPINDMYKYSLDDDIDRLDLMNQCLRWQTIAPTAPDTLASYPFIKCDPFLIEFTPHIYFSSNQPYFDTRIVQGLDGLGNPVYTRLLTVPEFHKTGQIVLINIASKTFETSTIKLSCN